MLFADDEHDKDHDDDTDADSEEDKNSEDEEEEEDTDEEDADDDSDDSEDDSDDDSDDEDDNKPITRKELRDALKGNKNDRNARSRISSKKDNKSKQPQDTKRLDSIEKDVQETKLLERKRTFGYENGLSPKQTNHVFRLTKRPTAKFIDKPHVKAALDAIKSQENVGKNTPSNSGRTYKSGGKEKEFKDLKPEEKQSNFADRRRAILESKK